MGGDLEGAEAVTVIRIPDWSEILDPRAPWGFVLRSGETGLWLLRQTAAEDEVDARIVVGGACPTAADLFEEWAQALELPDTFAPTWDALEAAVRDVRGPCGVLVTAAERLLSDEPARLPVLLEALRAAIAAAAADARVVRVVFQSRFDHDADRLAVFHEHGVVDIV